MNGRRDNVTWRLSAQLNDVFAEIGFDHFEPRGFHRIVERDFLAHHRFALRDRACGCLPADGEHDLTGLLGGGGPVHVGPRLGCLVLEQLQVEVEMREGVLLDVVSRGAKGLEFGECADGICAIGDKSRLCTAERQAQLIIENGFSHVGGELVRGRVHGCVPIP